MTAPTVATILLALSLTACEVRAQDDAAPPAETGTLTDENRAGENQADESFRRSVRVVRAERGALSVSRSATATVEPAQESQVSAAATGQIEAILVRSGARVAAGDAVIQLGDDALRLQLDNARLNLESARINLESTERSSTAGGAQSEAALQAAQSSLDLARQQFAEGEALLAAGGLAASDLAQLRVALEQAEASFLQAQAAADQSVRAPEEDLELLRLQVAQAETQVAQAEQAVADARLSAPFAGEVAEVLAAEGEFIGAGTPVFRLVSTERQIARFDVAPEDAARLLEQGQIWLPYGGLDYAAQVVRSAQTEGARLVEVIAELYPSEARIPNGTVTQFRYDLELAEGTLLPSGALRQSGGQASVLVVEGDSVAEVPVTLLSEGGAQVAVSGLEPGARVVFPLPADLSPGTPVEVLEEGA